MYRASRVRPTCVLSRASITKTTVQQLELRIPDRPALDRLSHSHLQPAPKVGDCHPTSAPVRRPRPPARARAQSRPHPAAGSRQC
eukprot:351182-Chlamydomonas_euryale.AAC.9